MATVHDFENVVTAVSDVSCNLVQLCYAVFFFGAATQLLIKYKNLRFQLSIDTIRSTFQQKKWTTSHHLKKQLIGNI